ncbi:helix-turn-helix domain-containing protein [Candidatus Uhrbacteria bacterium]|nr:helix-turn-helix domain-containing protein [Candidatus Uhrbacteria bacterium]
MNKAPKYNLSKLASKVKTLRTKQEMTREQLSKKAKVNYNTIIKLESGANKNPTVTTLIGIAMVFKCKVEDLIA